MTGSLRFTYIATCRRVRQPLLCRLLGSLGFLGSLVSQIVHTGSIVILLLQILHLLAHEHQANHVQDDDHAQEAVEVIYMVVTLENAQAMQMNRG